MIHKKRVYSVIDKPPEELAEALAEYTWTLCTGFRCDGHLYLNDSFSEDGAQEYVVIREATGEQVESVTVSWMTKEELLDFIKSIGEQPAEFGKVDLAGRIQTPEEHGRCHLCM